MTDRRSLCSLIKKQIPKPELITNNIIINRNSTPISYGNPIRRDNYNIHSNNSNNNEATLRRSNHRDASAGLVYEETDESHLNYVDIDHMIMLEDKLIDILSSIAKKNGSAIQCYEWWTYYFNSSLSGECYEEFFNSDKCSQVIIHTANNLELFAVLLSYFISIETPSSVTKYNRYLSNIFYYLHINYVLISKVIIEKTNMKIYSKQKRLWVDKVNEHLSQRLKTDKDKGDKSIVALKIKSNCRIIVEDIKSILSHYSNVGVSEEIIQTFNNLTRLNNSHLNEVFQELIYINGKKNNDNEDNNHQTPNALNANNEPDILPPFIKAKPRKPYTLVLDLDETLVSIKIINKASGKGKVKLRPGLIDFLTKVRDYYEVISFTAGNKEYADPVLNIIETTAKLFDYRLYKPHATLYQGEYIKNLSLIGRSLSSIIIIDNLANSYRLHKENGIIIKPFQGDCANDRVLNDLLSLLVKIAKAKGDIKRSLVKYKEEILSKVTVIES